MEGPKAYFSTLAATQFASIFMDVVESAGDLNIAKLFARGIDAEIDRLAANPGIGQPVPGGDLGQWYHRYMGYLIIYRTTKLEGYAIEVASIQVDPRSIGNS